MTDEPGTDHLRLVPYVPGLFLTWDQERSEPGHLRVDGSLAFVDISGFTRLTERLSRKGKVGAEEMSDILSSTFAALLDEAIREGADLVKWGGDAVLLLFQGAGHATRAARAAYRMRSAMRQLGRIETSSGTVALRMSTGVHSGALDFFLVGDPELHRELLVSGPGASTVAEVESAAGAGQIGLSAATASALQPKLLGRPLLDGHLLRAEPRGTTVLPRPPDPQPWRLGPAEALPPPVRQHLLSGAGEPEHRTITVAFVQFSGTDALLAREGAAALAGALDEVVRNVQHACAAHDVTFFETDINRDGGKIMLTAGAPRSTDHHEERMLRVARQVLDRAGRLRLRIGVNRGPVFAGDFGPAFRRTYSVKGDAVNVAARVMGKAAPGQLLATPEVVSRSQTAFHTGELAPFLVKGKSRPVQAVSVEALVGARFAVDLGVDLLGRSEELAVLTQAWEGAREGRGSTAEVVGGSGVGKTRLVTELLRSSEADVVSTRCEPYESSTAYFPFRKLLRDVLRISDDPVAAPEQLLARVSSLAPELLPWAPLLGVPLDLAVPATPATADLDPQFVRARLEALVVDVFSAALRKPTVILVEDAHAIDDASADLLRQLGTVAERRPWLLVATRRPQPPGFDPLPGERRTTVQLEPLDEAATLELARRALREHPLTPHAMRELARRSGGNPMFLEALLREAGRSGGLEELPSDIESLVASDIDRLSPGDRRVLRYAAVLGSIVDEANLDRLLTEQGGLDAEVLRRLDDFLVRGESGRLRFRSVLLRDVAYEGLPYRRRRLLHEQVGATIEQDSKGAEPPSELLSLHYFHAGNEPKAWHYSLVAGRRAVGKYAHGEAVDLFERATRSVPRDGSVAAEEQSAVYEQLADSRFLVGLTTEATQAYATARRLVADDPVRQALLVEKEVRVDLRRRKATQALRRLSRGLHELEGVEGRRAQVARSLLARRYAYSRFMQGRIDEALHWAEVGARFAEDAVDKAALAQAYEMLNAIYAGSGRAEPLPYGRLALQANRELGDLAPQGHCLNNLAVEAFAHGRWDEALANYRAATEIFRRIGDTASEGNAAFNHAELLVKQGRFEEAAGLLPEVLMIARAVEDAELVALTLREQAQTVAAGGDLDGALRLLDQARQSFGELGEGEEVSATDLVRAEVLLVAGRPRAAQELLGGPAPGDEEDSGLEARRHRLAAWGHRSEGRLDEAVAELVVGLGCVDAEQDRFEHALLLRDRAELARLRGEPGDAPAASRALRTLEAMGVVSGR